MTGTVLPPSSRYAEALAAAAERLASVSDSPRLDAEVLLCHVLGRPRSHLAAWPDRTLTPDQQANFQRLLDRRAAGAPVAYLTGTREFWSLPLSVTPDVLIPRPDTERLVERVLELGNARPHRLADLGTGSGAIALAVATERPAWTIVATDRSEAALAVARANAVRLGLGHIDFRPGDWCEALAAERFDFLVSNPPYVAAGDPHLNRGDVTFEPQGALVAADDGLADIRTLAAQAPAHLNPGGWLLVEHGFEQGPAVRRLLTEAGLRDAATHTDLAGCDRVTGARRA